MIRGIHSAASGMIAQMESQDVTANNLANVNTPGFKRDISSFSAILSGKLGEQSTIIQVQGAQDRTQGTLQRTDNPLNFALEGDGYFSVQTGNGVAYTRNGAFSLNTSGELVTQSGDRVMGTNGPIQLSPGDFKVDGRGQIFQGGRQVDTLQITRFDPSTPLGKIGGSLWTANGAAPASTGGQVRQGYLEGSNVNTMSEMVSMISGYRTYEASQKAVQSQDETLDKLVNEVGRVG